MAWDRRTPDTRTTEQRGYGATHRAERARRIKAMHDGDPCCRCGHPMRKTNTRDIHLDHDDHDRTRYIGLAHARCNRRAGAQRGQRVAHTSRTRTPQPRASRQW